MTTLLMSNFPGDEPTFLAARRFARQEFRSKRQLGPGTTEVAQAVEHAQGVTQILRENVVQGRHVGEDKYQLKMHEHTQRLDNETAGALKGTTKSFKDVKSSTF